MSQNLEQTLEVTDAPPQVDNVNEVLVQPIVTSPEPNVTSPEPKQKAQRNRKPNKKQSVSQLNNETQLSPVNLEPVFESVVTNPVQNHVENQTDLMEVDYDSIVDEFEQIPNEKQREMAYTARRALKEELTNQGKRIVGDFLGDKFDDDQKDKISTMITRLYDDSKTFFQAVKHANKGAIRGAFKKIGNIKLLDSSKAIQKIKKDKIQTFKEFLTNRMT